jgi:hypothetical protein
MKPSIILTALFALVCPMAEPLWADNEANTSARTALSWHKSVAMERQPGATAEEIQDFINDEFQRNGYVKSDRILRTAPAFTVWATKVVDGRLAKPHVVFLDAQGNALRERFGDFGELRVDAQNGTLVLRLVSEAEQVALAGGVLATAMNEESFEFKLPSLKKQLSKD